MQLNKPLMRGIQYLIAGRGLSMHKTLTSAIKSWKKRDNYHGISRGRVMSVILGSVVSMVGCNPNVVGPDQRYPSQERGAHSGISCVDETHTKGDHSPVIRIPRCTQGPC